MATPLLVAQLQNLLTDSNNSIGNLANAAALLYDQLPDVNWAGFYLYDHTCDQLVLGPFCGKIACMTIAPNHGVCGTSFAKKQAVVVPDVHQFSGHIACDAATNSEIVIPLIVGGRVCGVLDIDSPTLNRFSAADLPLLEAVSAELSEHLDLKILDVLS